MEKAARAMDKANERLLKGKGALAKAWANGNGQGQASTGKADCGDFTKRDRYDWAAESWEASNGKASSEKADRCEVCGAVCRTSEPIVRTPELVPPPSPKRARRSKSSLL